MMNGQTYLRMIVVLLTSDRFTDHYPLSTIHYPLSTVHYPLSSKKMNDMKLFSGRAHPKLARKIYWQFFWKASHFSP